MISTVQIKFFLVIVMSALWCSITIQAQQQPIKIRLKLEPKTQGFSMQSIFDERMKPSENEKSAKTPNGLLILVKRSETFKDRFHIWIDLNNNGKLTDERRVSLADNEKTTIEVTRRKGKIAVPFDLSLNQNQVGIQLYWKSNVQASGKVNIGNCSAQIYLQDINGDGFFEHLESGTNFQIDRNNDGKIWGAEEHLYSQEIIDFCGGNFLISYIERNGSFIMIERTNLQIAKVGFKAPQFELGLLNGKNISSNDLLGKPVLLDFWVSWCVPCIEKLPEAKNLEKEMPVFFINTDEKSRVLSADKIITKNDIRNISVMKGLGETDYLWKTFARMNRTLPFYVLIDGKGIIVYAGSGGEELRELKSKISELEK